MMYHLAIALLLLLPRWRGIGISGWQASVLTKGGINDLIPSFHDLAFGRFSETVDWLSAFAPL